jgi:hypothetical protein
MRRKLILWEIAGFFFIGLIGAALHFTFELSDFSNRVVAFFSAVNESTWEHLKMVFWPGFIFMLIEYTYVRGSVNNYFIAKTVGLFVMPLVIAIGWYAYTPFTGKSIFPLDLALFYLAVAVGQIISYKILTAPKMKPEIHSAAVAGFAVLLVVFSLFTFYPPRIFLFEHMDLLDTGQYGILEDYENLRFFTKGN